MIERRFPKWTLLLGLVCLIACLPALAADDSSSRISPPLQALLDAGAAGDVDVIVTFKSQPGSSDHADIALNRGQVKRAYTVLPMRAVRVPIQAIKGLSHNPNVEFISRDGSIKAQALPGRQTANLPNDGGIDYSVVSSGIGVAILDSGVGNHVDIWPSPTQYDFVGQASVSRLGPVRYLRSRHARRRDDRRGRL